MLYHTLKNISFVSVYKVYIMMIIHELFAIFHLLFGFFMAILFYLSLETLLVSRGVGVFLSSAIYCGSKVNRQELVVLHSNFGHISRTYLNTGNWFVPITLVYHIDTLCTVIIRQKMETFSFS